MEYKVPQNIDVEDKVIGPLTIRQFLIILIGGGILLILNFIFIGPLRIFFYVSVAIIGSLTLVLAFAKYGNQNIEVFLLSAFRTFINPRKRVWRKEEAKVSRKIKPQEANQEEPKDKRVNIKEARSNLDKLAELVDSGGYSAISDKSDVAIPDLIEQAEEKNNPVEKIIEQAEETAPKREKLVSEIATVSPNKKFEENPQIKNRDSQFN